MFCGGTCANDTHVWRAGEHEWKLVLLSYPRLLETELKLSDTAAATFTC